MESINSISICLNCYSIRFNEKRKPLTKSIQDVFGTTEILEIIRDFVKTIDSKKFYSNKNGDRILYLKNSLPISQAENIYSGIIMKGHNGPETSIEAVIKGEIKTIGTVNKDQYSCLPYFFMLYINKQNPQSIIFLAQSYKQYGFKEIFEESFRSFIINKLENITVHFNTLSIASLFEKYIKEGNINRLRFIKHGLLKSAESVLKGDRFKNETYEMEMAIKSKNGFLGIKDSLKYDNASFIEQVQIDGFDYDEAYIDISIAGRKRVMSVTKPSNFSAAFDITHDVRINSETNLPNFDDVRKQALDILKNDLIPYL